MADARFRAPHDTVGAVAFAPRINHVHANMFLDDLGHQAVHRTARRDGEMEHSSATLFLRSS